MPKDHYAVLHISPQAGQEVIDRAFRRLSLKYHPALNPSATAYEQIKEINEAWEVLSDPARRAMYDRMRLAAQETKPAGPELNEGLSTIPSYPASGQREENALHPTAIIPENLQLNSGSIWRIGLGLIALLIALLTLWGGQGRLIWIEAIILCASLLTYSYIRSEGSSRLEWLGLAALSVASVVILALAFPEFNLVHLETQAAASGAPNDLPAADSNPSPVTTATKMQTCQGGCRVAPPACFVKARVDPNGRRVYYMPGDRDYDQIAIDPASSGRWFCSEADAVGSGWVRYQGEPTPAATPDAPPSVRPVEARTLYVCAPFANVRSGPGLEFAVVKTTAERESWNVVGKVKQWYYVGRGEGGQALYIHETVLCVESTPSAPPRVRSGPDSGSRHPTVTP